MREYAKSLTGLFVAICLGSLAQGQALAASAPVGYQILCLKSPSECEGGGAARVVASEGLVATLVRINARVNREITPKADGAGDVWSVGVRAGDCEDYVLAKRRALVGAGVPASSLRIAFVKTSSGQDHAILMVNTSGGKIVLDNLSSTIRPLSQTRYRVISMQSADPKIWI